MIHVLTPEQMRDADARECARTGDVALMRNAGARIAELAARYARSGRIVAFAGPGNNGGDAFAALAVLAATHECVVYAKENPSPSPARADAEAHARAAGVRVEPFPPNAERAQDALRDCGLALDGLFGTGARLPLPAEYAPAIAALNACDAPVLAIDIPSGIDALTGAAGENAVQADATLALAALKPGLLLLPARLCAGELWCAQIGIAPDLLAAQPRTFAALDDAAFIDLLPQRAPDADKRSAGAPLVLAGSSQFPGAAVLCARGAARAGAGYVTVATSEAAAPILRGHLVEQVVVAISSSLSVRQVVADLLDTASHASAVAIGPGLGLDDRTGEIVRAFVEQLELPFVADASALFHFAKHLELLRGKRCVLTPHAGEFARLSGKGTVKESERVERLREFVDRTGITTLLKGLTTLVCDGTTVHLNPTGSNALATAGTGDVLTGIISTLLAQGLAPVDAARAGAYWHGLAGRYCAARRRVGVTAGDLPDALAAALPRRAPETALLRML